MSLTGVDVSNWQRGLDVSTVGVDVVVMKATEGTGFVDSTCDGFYQAARRGGRLRGVYHFARNRSNSSDAEADAFLSAVEGYVGDAVLVLDWEDGSGVSDVAWAKRWLDRVRDRTGVRPVIYMSASVAQAYGWEPVAQEYGLWVAGYPSSAVRGVERPVLPYTVGHGWRVVGWQYTSNGRVSGWSGALDLNVFYVEREGWLALAAKGGGGVSSSQGIAEDGVWGPVTLSRLCQVMGVSGEREAYAGVQYALSWQLDAYRVRAAEEAAGLEVTGRVVQGGVWSAQTTAVFQAWWNASGVPAGRRVVVDGVWGEATCVAFQQALNWSWSGSRGFAVMP